MHSDRKQVARGINSIQAIKEAGGWRVTGIMVQAESATAHRLFDTVVGIVIGVAGKWIASFAFYTARGEPIR